MKLNLGSGKRKREGYVNIDTQECVGADVIFDLENTPWFRNQRVGILADNSVDEILAHHVLEHLGQDPDVFLGVMQEIYRILKPNATIEIKIPHHRSDSFWGDPTHVRAITPEVLSLFSKSNCKDFAVRGWANTPLAEYIDVDFELISTNFGLTPQWGERYNKKEISREELNFAMMTYNNVIDETTMVLRKVPKVPAEGGVSKT